MIKEDLIKQLANRINQPHVVESWIGKIERAAYSKGVKDTETKQRHYKPESTNDRELLTKFALFMMDNMERGKTAAWLVEEYYDKHC